MLGLLEHRREEVRVGEEATIRVQIIVARLDASALLHGAVAIVNVEASDVGDRLFVARADAFFVEKLGAERLLEFRAPKRLAILRRHKMRRVEDVVDA